MRISVEEYLQAVEIVNRYREEQQQIIIEQSMTKHAEQERMKLIKDEIARIIEDEGLDNSRRRDIAQKRQALMFWLRANTGLTLYAIGKIFNRDHSSVLHACNVAQDAVKYKDYIFLDNAQVVYSRLDQYKRIKKNDNKNY